MPTLSHSSISLYLECPLKYKFKYVDRLKEKPKSYLSFGKSVHQALEFFFGSKPLSPPPLESLIDYYKTNWIKEGYKDQNEEDEYFEYGKSIIRDFYDKHTKSFKPPLAVEHTLNFEVEGIKIKAVMDRIDKLGEGIVEIIDYKTSKRPFNLTDLADEPQLTMYQLAVEHEMGLKVERLTYYHLPSQTPFTIPRHSDENIRKLKERIVDVAQKIENGEFPYIQNRYCPCDFGDLCPLYMHAYKKEVLKEEQAIDIIKLADEYGDLKDKAKEFDIKVDELQNEIKKYMEKEHVARVFGNKYEVTLSKSLQERLDSKKAREILEKNNLLAGLISSKEIESIRYKEKKGDEEISDFA